MKIGGRTRVFAILGDPVAHSLSPAMHNAGFLAEGIDAVYVPLRVTADSVAATMRVLVSGGGGGNVTIPFKLHAAELADVQRDARVERLGSANVFAASADGMQVANTDVHGILGAVDQLGDVTRCWRVVGTGGSARSVVGAAFERGARVSIVSRSPDRAAEFAAWAAERGVPAAAADECGLVINATPLGLVPSDPLPLDLAGLPPETRLLDLVYLRREETRWVAAARTTGRHAIDGREVLLAQGVASWPIWFPKRLAPVDIMRAAINGSLG
ncbi:MAG TPA: hypothetical protein VGM77_08800 [Gemmatimonadales bacterium]|jgi:shikimate dehydrogenase